MSKMSIWKRFGGWLRGNAHPEGGSEISHLDAEGLLIHNSDYDEIHTPKAPAGDAPLPARHGSKKEQQLAAMEDAFNRLVEVLENMNDNVRQHRQQTTELNSRMELVVDSLQALPDSITHQHEVLQNIVRELKNQTLSGQQVSETLKNLPESTRENTEKLEEVIKSLEHSLENQAIQTDSINRFEQSIQSVSENTRAQTLSMANIGQMLQENESRLQEMVDRQNKRFGWLIVTAGILAVSAAAAAAAIVWYVITNGTPPAA